MKRIILIVKGKWDAFIDLNLLRGHCNDIMLIQCCYYLHHVSMVSIQIVIVKEIYFCGVEDEPVHMCV